MRKSIMGLAVVALLAPVVFFGVMPTVVDWRSNAPHAKAPYTAHERAQALHKKLYVADLHDDFLLWNRDLLIRYSYGETDLPRLQEGHVALQVFATVTKTPKNMNFESNPANTDNITMLVMAQRWPRRTWDSLLERALYQSEKLHAAATQSEGKIRIIRTQADLQATLQMQGGSTTVLAAVLATEGLQPLEGKLENVDKLFDAGFRITGLTHFFDNELGGSAHGLEKGGITPFGRQVIARLEEKKILVDVAHASPKLIDDVLAMAKRPIVVSHTGVKGTCTGPRNLSDAHIKAIAATGGVIGIAYFEGAVCDASPAGIVKAIQYAVNLAGIEHVALGSDYDGAAHNAFDTTGLVLITQGLMDAGYSEADIADIMGGNVQRLLLAQLP